jgi:hypothetical protein
MKLDQRTTTVCPSFDKLRMCGSKGYILFLIFLCSFSFLKPVKRDAEEVFGRWQQIQFVVDDVDLREMQNYLGEFNVLGLKARYDSNMSFLKDLIKFFQLPTNEQVEKVLKFVQEKISDLQTGQRSLLE